MSMDFEIEMIKLGGSLITDKSVPFAARCEVLKRVADEIADAQSAAASRGVRVIVLHGSGSFGHVTAAEHLMKKQANAAGVSATQDAAHRLHGLVVEALRKAGLSAFSIAPSSLFVAHRGAPRLLSIEPLRLALAMQLTPVLFGDVVMDREVGACILSTESVCIGLAQCGELRIKRALWLGSTDGVLDGDGAVVGTLDRRELETLGDVVGASHGVDVTGGMRHRVESALQLSKLGVQSTIANGNRGGLLKAFLRGEQVPCTVVKAEGQA